MLLVQCDEYRSPVPITDKPSSPLPVGILGEWIFVDTTAEIIELVATLTVTPWSRNEYLALYCDYEGVTTPQEPCLPLRIYTSSVGRETYVNAHWLTEDGMYTFYKYRLLDSLALELHWAGDTFEPVFNTSKAFRAYLRKHPDLFAASFDANQGLWYRRSYWNWSKANAAWLEKIDAAWQFPVPAAKDSFLTWTGETLLAQWPHESISTQNLITIFDRFHIEGAAATTTNFSSIWGPDPDGFFLIRMKGGEMVKFVTYPRSLVDLSNRFQYALSD